MLALLRYIYDLPFFQTPEDKSDRLLPHARVYVVADKYQVSGLKLAVRDNMESIIESHDITCDFVDALKTIVTGTAPHDNNHAHKLMVDTCAMNLQEIRQNSGFISLLREHADLGVEIIRHQDLECGFPGDWVCSGGVYCSDRCVIVCGMCDRKFGFAFSWKHRDRPNWLCKGCGNKNEPRCESCNNVVEWQRRGLEHSEDPTPGAPARS